MHRRSSPIEFPKSKECELIASARGRIELGTIQVRAILLEPQPVAGEPEPLGDHFGIGSFARKARAEFGVVELAAAHLPHECEHVLGALREMRLEPLGEEVLDLEREAEE